MPSHTLVRPAPAPDARRLGTTHPATVPSGGQGGHGREGHPADGVEPLDQAVHQPGAPDQGQSGQQRHHCSHGADRHDDGEERDEVGGIHEAWSTPAAGACTAPDFGRRERSGHAMFEAAPAG